MFDKFTDALIEEIEDALEQIEEGRFKKVNRIRAGKEQRRKKVASKAGFTVRKDGKVEKLSRKERRTREISQKRGARKRKGKLARSLRSRGRSLKKRSRLGFDK